MKATTPPCNAAPTVSPASRGHNGMSTDPAATMATESRRMRRQPNMSPRRARIGVSTAMLIVWMT